MKSGHIKPIHTKEDYEKAMDRIETLWDAKPGTPEEDELEVLTILVSDYEDRHYPMGGATPLDALEFHMERLGKEQRDLAELLGSRSRASEVLSGARELNLEQMRKVHSAWGIPYDLLIGFSEPAAAAKRAPTPKAKLAMAAKRAPGHAGARARVAKKATR